MTAVKPLDSTLSSIKFSKLPNPIQKTKVEIIGDNIFATINGDRYKVEIENREFTQFITGDVSSRGEMTELVEKVAEFLKTNNLLNHTNTSVQINETGIASLTQDGNSIADNGWNKDSIKEIGTKFDEIITNPLNSYTTYHITQNLNQKHHYTLDTYGAGKCGPLAIQDQLYQIKHHTSLDRLSEDVNEPANQAERIKVSKYITDICKRHRKNEKLAEKIETDSGITNKETQYIEKELTTIQSKIKQDGINGQIPESCEDEYLSLVNTDLSRLTREQKAKILRYWTAEEIEIRTKVINAVEYDHGIGQIPDTDIQEIINNRKGKKPSPVFYEHAQFTHEQVLKILDYRAQQYEGSTFWAREDFLEVSAYANNKTIVVLAKNEKGIPVITTLGKLPTSKDPLENVIFITSNGVLNSETDQWSTKTTHYESVNREKTAFLHLIISRIERDRINTFSECINHSKDNLAKRYRENLKNLPQRARDYVVDTINTNQGKLENEHGILIDKFYDFAADNFNGNKIWKELSKSNHKGVKKFTGHAMQKIHSISPKTVPTSSSSPSSSTSVKSTASKASSSTPSHSYTTAMRESDLKSLNALRETLNKHKDAIKSQTAIKEVTQALSKFTAVGKRSLENLLNQGNTGSRLSLPEKISDGSDAAYTHLYTISFFGLRDDLFIAGVEKLLKPSPVSSLPPVSPKSSSPTLAPAPTYSSMHSSPPIHTTGTLPTSDKESASKLGKEGKIIAEKLCLAVESQNFKQIKAEFQKLNKVNPNAIKAIETIVRTKGALLSVSSSTSFLNDIYQRKSLYTALLISDLSVEAIEKQMNSKT